MKGNGSGKLARKTDDGVNGDLGVGGPIMKIKVYHGSDVHQLIVLSNFTFGDLKNVIAQEIGLEPQMQKLFFRGQEKQDREYLHTAGVKDNAKVLLQENPSSNLKNHEIVKGTTEIPTSHALAEQTSEEVNGTTEISRGVDEVYEVRTEVDNLSELVSALQAVVYDGSKIQENDILYITEMLMKQLLKLDSIDAVGEGRVQRKMEVQRVQSLVETMDNIKERNANPLSNFNSSVGDNSKGKL